MSEPLKSPIVDGCGRTIIHLSKKEKQRDGCPGCGASTETKWEALGGVSYCKECGEQLEGKK